MAVAVYNVPITVVPDEENATQYRCATTVVRAMALPSRFWFICRGVFRAARQRARKMFSFMLVRIILPVIVCAWTAAFTGISGGGGGDGAVHRELGHCNASRNRDLQGSGSASAQFVFATLMASHVFTVNRLTAAWSQPGKPPRFAGSAGSGCSGNNDIRYQYQDWVMAVLLSEIRYTGDGTVAGTAQFDYEQRAQLPRNTLLAAQTRTTSA